METIVVEFYNYLTDERRDIEIQLNMTAEALVHALNDAYALGIDLANKEQCYLQTENPIAFLQGEATLAQFGLRDGCTLYYIR